MAGKNKKIQNGFYFQKGIPLERASLDHLLKSSVRFSYPKQDQKTIKIEEELAIKEKLKNDDYNQDITLKRITLYFLLILLTAESLVIFTFAFLQATKFLGFALEEWSFRLIIGATITQIYLMLKVAVKYLFPIK